MKFEITDPKNLLSKQFCHWLIEKIRDKIIKDVDKDKLEKFTIFLTSDRSPVTVINKSFTVDHLILQGAKHLVVDSVSTGYSIHVDDNVFATGLDVTRLNTACKLINFGNTQIEGYPIFTNTFDYFSENLSSYVDRYINGRL